MADAYISEIKLWPINFVPRGWAACNGQLLAISTNQALFSLIGTTYGGDGQTTFALPDMRGRVPIHAGNGPGLSARTQGTPGGVDEVALTTLQIPPHNHQVRASTTAGSVATPGNTVLPASPPTVNGVTGGLYIVPFSGAGTAATVSPVPMGATAIGVAGASTPHENRMPFSVVNYIICLSGFFPSRN